MSPQASNASILGSIFHPSDFSEGSNVAFAHALKAALVAHAKLTVLHASPERGSVSWTQFPGVRETLERWGLLPKGSPRSAVPKLGIDVQKVVARGGDPVREVLDYLDSNASDLIVLATRSHDGRASWLRKSVSEPIARGAGQATLFVPAGVPGFVSLESGAVSLSSILIPIAAEPRPQAAIAAAVRLAQQLQCPKGEFTLLHVGRPGSAPVVTTPRLAGWRWHKLTQPGDVIAEIAGAARTTKAGLIVMATDGRSGFLDALRGSHSERVLHAAPCPVLAIPKGSYLAGAVRASSVA
jgi:nucleotide-binding universal stress UspA family protein